MSEQNPRLANWDKNKAAYERQQFEKALYGDAGEETFDEAARARVHEADAYERHMERLAGTGTPPEEEKKPAPEPESGTVDTTPRHEEPAEPEAPGHLPEALRTPSRVRRLGTALMGVMHLHDAAQAEPAYEPEPGTPTGTRTDLTNFVTVSVDRFSRPRTVDDLARIIDEDEVQHRMEAVETPKATVESLLEHESLRPAHGIELDNKQFLFSGIVQRGNYMHAVAYVSDHENNVTPRLYYRSQSDGGWRVTPGLYATGRFSKGAELIEPHEEYGHYVQLTKPDENIIALLETIQERQSDIPTVTQEMKETINASFGLERAKRDGEVTFGDEVSTKEVHGIGTDAYLSGRGFTYDREQAIRDLENMELPGGFEPDFTGDPVQIYTTNHTLAGKVAVEVYPATLEGREIEWHLARDNEGRVWVDRIEFADGKLTTYGSRSEVILAGALSAKPFDYESQTDNMLIDDGGDAVAFNDTYVDATPLLKKMAPLQRYQRAKGLL